MRRRPSYDQLVRRRSRTVLWVMVAGYAILAARLFHLQVVRGSSFREYAESQTQKTVTIPAHRGTIYDRNGVKLAVTVDSCDVAARPKAIENKRAIAETLAPLLQMDSDEILRELNSHSSYFYLKRRADADAGVRVRKLKLTGIDVETLSKRVYPNDRLASHILGFVGYDGHGVEGLERSLDKILAGKDGKSVSEKDAKGVIIPGTEKLLSKPVNGKDVWLSIDSVIQHSLETELAAKVEQYKAAGASAVVLDPRDGSVMALANMPDFDPNDVSGSPAAARRNRAVMDLYEPGSTLKTMTVCAGLEDRAISTTDTFGCTGRMRIGRRTIRCSLHGREFAHGHGIVDASKILRYSCNIGAAGIGFKLGAKRLHDYDAAFGLYERPGSELPGEASGWRDPAENWIRIHLANVAFGQGIAVTPLQMAKAYVAVANGGDLMRPFIVKEIRSADGKVVSVTSPRIIRKVVSAETAGEVCQMLLGVVDEKHGTGKTAKVAGYKVGGKTGSAEKASTTGRGYAAGRYVASFAGLLPISDPRAVILVMVDEPKGSHFGASVAAPVFKAVAQKIMWYLRVPPDDDEDSGGSRSHGRRGGSRDDDSASGGEQAPVRIHLGGQAPQRPAMRDTGSGGGAA